jgi:large subunit ribosomal protein L17
MRHLEAGKKLGRNTSHRRALLRNLVTSLILEERIETTEPKAKAMRPHVEKMITLGKRGDVAARRLAASYLMTRAAVDKLFDTVAPRMGDRNGGYLRIIRTGWQKGDGAEKAFVELIGSEKAIAAKQHKRAEARAKRREETKKAMEEAEAQAAFWREDLRGVKVRTAQCRIQVDEDAPAVPALAGACKFRQVARPPVPVCAQPCRAGTGTTKSVRGE